MFGGMLCMCLGIAVLLSGHQGPVMQVARIIGAAADLSEHTTGVAVQALNATTQLASGATELFLSVASSGLSSGANLWHGVDLTGLYARRCAGQLLALQRQLLAASQTVGMTMPSAQTSTEELELDGTYCAVRIWGSLHGSGQIQLQFDFVQVDFTPRWANPVWQQWQVPLDGEREQIMRLLRQTVVQLPAPPIHAGQAVLEIQPEIAWTHVRDRLVAWARGLSLHFFSGLSRFLQSGGLLNFLHWLDEHFLATLAGLATLTIFSAIVGAVKSMHVNGVSTRPPALPLAILDGRLENQVPPSLEALLTAAAPLSEALLSNSDISSSSYVKVNQGVAAVRLVGRPCLPKIVLSWSVGHKWMGV